MTTRVSPWGERRHGGRGSGQATDPQEAPMSQTTTRPTTAGAGNGAAGRPFRIEVPEEAITDLRRRVAATVWPEQETVADTSQGVPLATMQELARHWATGDARGRRDAR